MVNRSQIQIKCILGLIYILAAPLAIGACQSPPIYIFVDGSKEMYLHRESNYFEQTLLSLSSILNQWQPALEDRGINVPSITVQGIGLVKKARVPITPTFYELSPGKDVNKLRNTKWLLPGSPRKGLPQKSAWPHIEKAVLEKQSQDNRIVLFFSNSARTSALRTETDPKKERLFISVYLPDRDKAKIGELAKSAFTQIDSFLKEYCVTECPTATLEFPTVKNLGERVEFRCRLDGTADGLQFRWELGDGQTSDLKDPRHVYAEPGCYTVRLTIIDRDGKQCPYKQRKITIQPQMHIKDVPKDVLAGKTIRFAMHAPGALRSEWDFGDKSERSRAETPQHSYKLPGKYQVKAKTFFKCDLQASDDWTVRVHNVLFSPEPPVSVDVGETVNFRFESDTADKPQWNFGDGTVSTLKRPPHAYETPGEYTVVLTVRFAAALKKSIKHRIRVVKPVAELEWLEAKPDADRAEPNVEFSFTNTSVGFDRDNPSNELRHRSAYVQNYHFYMPPLNGHYWHWLWGKALWTKEEVYSGVGWHYDGEHMSSGTVTYECYVTPFDALNQDWAELSDPHDLTEDAIIGLSWSFLDADVADDTYDAFWAFNRQGQICCNGAYLADFKLMPIEAELFDKE